MTIGLTNLEAPARLFLLYPVYINLKNVLFKTAKKN